jgi:hypothetical protein
VLSDDEFDRAREQIAEICDARVPALV